jgi:hypothetical protein
MARGPGKRKQEVAQSRRTRLLVFVRADPDDLPGALSRLREGTSLWTPLRMAVLGTFDGGGFGRQLLWTERGRRQLGRLPGDEPPRSALASVMASGASEVKQMGRRIRDDFVSTGH